MLINEHLKKCVHILAHPSMYRLVRLSVCLCDRYVCAHCSLLSFGTVLVRGVSAMCVRIVRNFSPCFPTVRIHRTLIARLPPTQKSPATRQTRALTNTTHIHTSVERLNLARHADSFLFTIRLFAQNANVSAGGGGGGGGCDRFSKCPCVRVQVGSHRYFGALWFFCCVDLKFCCFFFGDAQQLLHVTFCCLLVCWLIDFCFDAFVRWPLILFQFDRCLKALCGA